MDLNDQLRAGAAPKDPKAGASPASEEAKASQENEPLRVYSLRDLLVESGERAVTELETKGVCPTGHFELDQYTAGFRPGFTWVIAADTSVGKSSFLIALTDESIRHGKRVLIVSSEDAPQVYGDRLLARRARISADRLRKHRLHPDEQDRVKEVVESAENVPVYIEAGNRPIEKLEKEIRAVVRNEHIDLIAFDYLQEFTSSRKHQDERTKYKHIAKIMRWIMKSEGKTGAILSQLTINSETKVPNRHNIRECRDVANGAEVIAILFMTDEDIAGQSPGRDVNGRPIAGEPAFEAGVRYLLLDKNKDGPRGKKIRLAWNEESACFDSVKDPETERLARFADEVDTRVGIDDDFFA